MNIALMVLAIDTQSKDPRGFDYASFIADKMNRGLEKIKGDPNQIAFTHYSLLMHMLLFVGEENNLWRDDLPRHMYNKKGMKKSVQL